MQNDLLKINQKLDKKIQTAQDALNVLLAEKQSLQTKVKEYYAAVEAYDKADKIIKKGKPTI